MANHATGVFAVVAVVAVCASACEETTAPVDAAQPALCVPGASTRCTCDDTSSGARECDGSGSPGSCVCGPVLGCDDGESRECTCGNGVAGLHSCTEGRFGVCLCGDPPDAPRCMPGASVSCTCTDGESGTQRCQSDGIFAPCACGPVLPPETDAAVDGGDDASSDAEAGMDGGDDADVPDSGMSDSGFDAEMQDADAPDGPVSDAGHDDDCGVGPYIPPGDSGMDAGSAGTWDAGPALSCPDPSTEVVAGSFTISSATDLVPLQSATTLVGDLVINAPGLAEVALPNLVSVMGSVIFQQGPTTLRLPCLRTATNVELPRINSSAQVTAPDLLDLRALEEADNLFIQGGGRPHELPALARVTDTLRLEGTSEYLLPSLSFVSTLVVRNTAGMSFDSLQTVHELHLQGRGGAYFFPLVTRVFRELRTGFDAHYYFPALTRARSVILSSSGWHDLPLLATVDGMLTTAGSSVLLLPALVRVGGLQTSGRELELPLLERIEPTSGAAIFLADGLERLEVPRLVDPANVDVTLVFGGFNWTLAIERAANVTIEGTLPAELMLPSLREVDVVLRIRDTSGGWAVRLPQLERAGVLWVDGNGAETNRCTAETLREVDFPALAEISGDPLMRVPFRDSLRFAGNVSMPESEAIRLRDQVVGRLGITGNVDIEDAFVAPPSLPCPDISILEPADGSTFNRREVFRIRVQSASAQELRVGSVVLDDSDGDGIFEGDLSRNLNGFVELTAIQQVPPRGFPDGSVASIGLAIGQVDCESDGDCRGSYPHCALGQCQSGNLRAPCDDSDDCEPANPVCAQSRCTEGGFCDDEGDCPSFAPFCGDGLCVDGTAGDPCDGDEDCCPSAPHCGDNGIDDPACWPGGEGDPCDDESDCAPGWPHCVVDSDGIRGCYDGTALDPCESDEDCTPPTPYCVDGPFWHWRPDELDTPRCRSGQEDEYCADALDCSPQAPFCAVWIPSDNPTLCRVGVEGDPCFPTATPPCSAAAPFCVSRSWGSIDIVHSCETGDQGAPCNDDSHCLPAAPNCVGAGLDPIGYPLPGGCEP